MHKRSNQGDGGVMVLKSKREAEILENIQLVKKRPNDKSASRIDKKRKTETTVSAPKRSAVQVKRTAKK